MNATNSTAPIASKAIFERAIKKLDESFDSTPDSRHRPIGQRNTAAIAESKSQERALKDAADALAALWRNQRR